jgi:tetratricopeptide (TPR) repeat protein
MVLLQCVLLILFVLATLVSGFGYDPLAPFLFGAGGYVLPGMLAVALFCVLVYRSQNLAEQVTRTLEELTATQEQHREALARFETAAACVEQLSEEVQTIRRAMAQSEFLLPGRLLLLQRRYEEAAKVFQEAVASHADSPEARWLLGETLFEAKRYVEALPHLLAGLVPYDVRRLALVAQCEQALGRYADAEAHLLRLIAARGESRQDDLVALGAVQSELDPERARETLTHALALNPYNSVARYQLIDLEIRTAAYERALALATEGLQWNPADVGCCVSRAEAYFRRGRIEDEAAMLEDLATAQAKNRKDYNIYRLRGALYQRRASRAHDRAVSQQALLEAVAAYEEGLTNVPPKFHAHLLTAESRVFLQLKRFDEAIVRAQRAVEHYPGHVSNHLALAFARLASRQWKAAAQAAERGMQWAGWGGRVWLTAIGLFATAFVEREPAALRQKCAALAADLKTADRHFALSESWEVVRAILQEAADHTADSRRALVTDTIALLEHTITPEQYRHKWAEAPAAEGHSVA